MKTKINTERGFYYVRTNIDISYTSEQHPDMNWELPAGSIVIAPIESDHPEGYESLGKRTIAEIPNQKKPIACGTISLHRYENSDTKEFEVLGEVPSKPPVVLSTAQNPKT